MKRTFFTLLSTALLATQSLLAVTAQAAPAGLYFNPTNATVNQGATLNVQLRLNNTNANNVEAHFTFDPARLTITAKQTTGTDFSTTDVQYDNGAGTVSVTGTNGPSATADKFVAGLTFKALSEGTATLTFTGTNQTSVGLLGTGLLPAPTASPTTHASYMIIAPTNTSNDTPSTTAPIAGSAGSGSTTPSSPISTAPLTPAPSASNATQKPPHTETHQEEIEGAYSRITGEAASNDTLSKNTRHNATVPIALVIGSISATLLAISLYFIYRGHRLARLAQWFRREALMALLFDPHTIIDVPKKRRFTAHVGAALKLITYHPLKLLESGQHHHVPFSKRRSAK